MQLRQYWIHALHVVGHRCRSAHQLYTYVRLPYSLSKPRTLGIPTTSYKSWHRHALQLMLGWSVTLSQAGSAYNRPNNHYHRHGFWLINSVANKSQTYYAIFCCLPRLSSPVPGSGSCCHIAVQSHLDAQNSDNCVHMLRGPEARADVIVEDLVVTPTRLCRMPRV